MAHPGPSTPAASEDFTRAFREHYAGMCQFVRRYVQSNTAAEDVVQDVWAAIWRSGGAPEKLTRAYLYTAARHHALHVIAHRQVETRHADAVRADPPAIDVVDTTEVDEMTQAAAQAVAALPERCRMIYQMVRNDGMTYADVASALEISVSTVEVQMWRALKRLRQAMAPYFVLACLAAWRG